MADTWTKEKLLRVSGEFQVCRILLTAAELDLFAKLQSGPKSIEEICRTEGWSSRGLRILMDALVALGLLIKTPEGSYTVDEAMARLMTWDVEGSVLPMVLHRVTMWESWSKLTEIVQTGTRPQPLVAGARTTDKMAHFIGAMHVVGRELAETVAGSLDLTPYRRLLDVGGGSGTYIMAFLKRAPHMTATLFDFPEVIEMARQRLTEKGFIDRVTLKEGDYSADPLPEGHDLVLLSAVIHSNTREENQHLFSSVHRCLLPGGTILIRDHVLDSTRTRPLNGAIFAVNMLAATEGGNSHSLDDIREDLEASGFHDVRLIRDGEKMDQLVTAVK